MHSLTKLEMKGCDLRHLRSCRSKHTSSQSVSVCPLVFLTSQWVFMCISPPPLPQWDVSKHLPRLKARVSVEGVSVFDYRNPSICFLHDHMCSDVRMRLPNVVLVSLVAHTARLGELYLTDVCDWSTQPLQSDWRGLSACCHLSFSWENANRRRSKTKQTSKDTILRKEIVLKQ